MPHEYLYTGPSRNYISKVREKMLAFVTMILTFKDITKPEKCFPPPKYIVKNAKTLRKQELDVGESTDYFDTLS